MSEHVYIEFGGGLGDIFNQLYTGHGYRFLETLGPGRTAHVGLVTHNPHAIELFRWHPQRQFITHLVHYGYWDCAQDGEFRLRHAIPPPSRVAQLMSTEQQSAPIRFYPAPTESIDGLGHAVAVSASAGLSDRTLPQPVLDAIVSQLLTAGWDVLLLGRSFNRHGRTEIRPSEPELIHCRDLIDQLSVPATAQVIQACAGLVTCHSALNILAWHLRKPQLLLYPESVEARHFRRPDQWSFGAKFPETFHGRFDADECAWRSATGLFLQYLDGSL